MILKAPTLPTIFAVWIFLVGATSRAAEPAGQPLASDPELEKLLEPIREKHKVPGLVAGILEGNKLTAAAVGVRKAGAPDRITVNDKLHLGSNTKSMTATRIGLLVEEGKLSWESTVGEVFSHLKQEMHADAQGITLTQLLTHRSGLPANSFERIGTGTLVEQREMLVTNVLSRPPVHPPGTKFLYSNAGYTIAGHMAEQVTGKASVKAGGG